MQSIIKLYLDNGRVLAANIRAKTHAQALRKGDFLAYDIEQSHGVSVSRWEVMSNIRAYDFGFTTVNTKTGKIAGAKLFELVFTD